MANEEHLARLQEGVDAWNAWREEHPSIAPDLSQVDFSRMYLYGANLARARLFEANLRQADLSEADLSRADRARAMLLTLEGWTSVELAEVFGVTADSVRHWRNWFTTGGVEALHFTLAPGPSPEKGETALAVARALLSEPVENRTNWTLPRRQAEIERRAGLSISKSRLSILLREKRGSVGGGPDTR